MVNSSDARFPRTVAMTASRHGWISCCAIIGWPPSVGRHHMQQEAHQAVIKIVLKSVFTVSTIL